MAAMEGSGPAYADHTSDGFTVSTNSATSEEMKANFEAEPKPKDGETPDPEKEAAEEVSRAAKKLGQKGGEAAAKARSAKPPVQGETDGVREEGSGEDGEAVRDEAGTEKPLGKPRHDPRARVAEVTREAAELKRQLAAERAERERLSREIAARAQPEQPKAPAKDPNAPPDPKDYASYEEYVEAKIEWGVNRKAQEFQRKQQAEARAHQWAQAVYGANTTYRDRVHKYAETTPAFFDELSEDMNNLTPSSSLDPTQDPLTAENIIADEIILSEVAPQLMLHFSKNPEEFQRIAALRSADLISRAVAKIEAKLEAAPTATSHKLSTSKAHAPVRPVTGTPTAVTPEGDDDESLDTYIRRENARELQARRGR